MDEVVQLAHAAHAVPIVAKAEGVGAFSLLPLDRHRRHVGLERLLHVLMQDELAAALVFDLVELEVFSAVQHGLAEELLELIVRISANKLDVIQI